MAFYHFSVSALMTVHERRNLNVLQYLTDLALENNRFFFSGFVMMFCYQRTNIQLTLVILNSLITNNRLSRSENLVPA